MIDHLDKTLETLFLNELPDDLVSPEAWASDSSPDPAGEEHRLLGEVMMVLLRHPTIPERTLRLCGRSGVG